MSQKLTVYWQRGFGSFIKTAFYVWLAKVRRKNCFFLKKHNVLFCFGFSSENFLIMDEKFMVALLELNSTCLANVSIKLDILNFLSHLSGTEQKEVGILVNNCPQDCRNYIIRVQKITLTRDIFFESIFFWKLILDHEINLFALLNIVFSAGLLNLNSMCPEKHLAKVIFTNKV